MYGCVCMLSVCVMMGREKGTDCVEQRDGVQMLTHASALRNVSAVVWFPACFFTPIPSEGAAACGHASGQFGGLAHGFSHTHSLPARALTGGL